MNVSIPVTHSFYSTSVEPMLGQVQQMGARAFESIKEFHAYGTASSTPLSYRIVYQISTTIATCVLLYRIVPLSAREGVVLAPILEEFVFRGFLQTAIAYVQKAINQVRRFVFKTTFSVQDLKAQEVFRVRMQAVVFGLIHALQPHGKMIFKIIQVTSALWGGLVYGYLKESTHSIAPGIVLHAMNNGSAEVGMCLVGNITNDAVGIPIMLTPFALHLFLEWNIYKKLQAE